MVENLDWNNQLPQPIDNVSMRLGDDLVNHFLPGADVQIASFGFSLSAFERLENALQNVHTIRFVFTTPAFSPQNGIQERLKTERREYYIPGLGYVESFDDRYEIRIRNRLQQRAIARKCAKWIKKGLIQFRAVTPETPLQDVLTIQCGEQNVVYLPFPGFTSGALGFEPDTSGAMISTRLGGAVALPFRQRFDAVWNSGCLSDITQDIARYMDGAYRENEPSLVWFLMLYHLFGNRLQDFDPDTMPNPHIKYKETLIWQKLFPFQRDAAIAIINKLEKFNGCILADSVGLGKTYTALAVIKYYELRNKDVLVLTPKRLEDNWNSFNQSHYKTNPFRADDFCYKVLCHTDLQRERGISNGIDFSKKFDWSAFDLVVIDESHNFRNDKGQYAEKETRYQTLARFAPLGKEVSEEERAKQGSLDILFATDCISEGQNLQDCDCVINYDIHWNPVRIIQRFGRVDRLRSPNTSIKMINFWPNLEMDEYLRLRRRVTDRMTIANLSGTGADNPLKDEDFAFREEHLMRMKDGEIVDMESLNSGVSITDLGLGEYALSLKTYLESHDLSRTPIGIDAVIPAHEPDLPPGVIFFLRNRDEKLKNPENIFHPFYSVYVDRQGEVILGATQGKEILERLRTVCPNADKPFDNLCRAFNAETNDGKDMSDYSALLDKAIASLMTEKESADIHSLFTSATATLAPKERVKDNSFELITFFIIRDGAND